jgi:cytochrome P450
LCRAELREKGLLPEEGASASSMPDLTLDILDTLHYCDAVVKETFRAGFSTAGAFRTVAEDTSVLGVPLKKGQQLMWVSCCSHKDKEQWTGDTYTFEPKRFVPEHAAAGLNFDASNSSADVSCGSDTSHHAYAFLPFGGGVHGCAGKHLAWIMLKSLLVRMMQRGVRFEDTKDNTGGCKPMVRDTRRESGRVKGNLCWKPTAHIILSLRFWSFCGPDCHLRQATATQRHFAAGGRLKEW